MRYGHRKFKVGVFPQAGKRKLKFNAYLRDYNPQWSDCCEHEVIAEFGWEAKEKAIHDHKSNCVPLLKGVSH